MIIGTAGHVDHGKSALVQALTGQAVDRLAEERRRGITIELGFTSLTIGGAVHGVVDVPGHEDFVRTMVAGASGIDVALLVIAADDGIMPQTREHLLALERLGVPAGIPVITKADLVEPDWLELVCADVAAWLAPSPVRFVAPIAASARTGMGLEEVRNALACQVDAVGDRARHASGDSDLFRLPVDRTFSVAGAGTVVTGTAWSGSVRAGDSVQLWPGGALARVRGIEVHGEPCDATVPGRRTALALNGVSVRHAARGSVVVRPGDGWSESTALDVELDLSGSRTSLRPGERIWLHLGTAAVLARVGGASELIPRGRMPVRLRLERPLLARGGDRFVVRTYSPVAVIGGGIVLDPQPVPSRVPAEWSSEAASRLSVLVSRRRWGIGMEVWPVLAGPLPPGSTRQHVLAAAQLVEVGGRVLARADREAHSARIRALVSAHHEARPHEPGVGLEALRQQLGAPPRLADALVSEAVRAGHVLVVGDVASLPGFSMPTEATEAQARHLCQVLAQARMAPTPIASLAQVLGFEPYRLLQELERAGEVVRLTSELAILAVSLTEFRRLLEEIGRAGPITPAAIRDRSGLSRKHTIPLLEWADRTGITVRTGDARTLRPAPSGTHSSAPAALPG